MAPVHGHTRAVLLSLRREGQRRGRKRNLFVGRSDRAVQPSFYKRSRPAACIYLPLRSQ